MSRPPLPALEQRPAGQTQHAGHRRHLLTAVPHDQAGRRERTCRAPAAAAPASDGPRRQKSLTKATPARQWRQGMLPPRPLGAAAGSAAKRGRSSSAKRAHWHSRYRQGHHRGNESRREHSAWRGETRAIYPGGRALPACVTQRREPAPCPCAPAPARQPVEACAHGSSYQAQPADGVAPWRPRRSHRWRTACPKVRRPWHPERGPPRVPQRSHQQ